MAPKYDDKLEMSMEHEGSYHSRQVEHIRPGSPPRTATTSYKTTSYDRPSGVGGGGGGERDRYRSPSRALATTRHETSGDDTDNYEEWTTTKRKVNHKTRQVETRVSRKLLVEDGRVIADSGPQVTTRIKEDNKLEESEKEKAPRHKGRFEALENAPECELGSGGGRVLGEKKETIKTSREVREENMQYHDEMYKELTGHDVHRKALANPNELVAISESRHSGPRGKMVHYSNKGKRYQDTDEILEVAKLALDGSISKERKHTRHHEELSDTERPGDEHETEELRRAPKVERSSRRHVDYVHRDDDFDTPEGSDSEREEDAEARRKKNDLLRYNEEKHNQLGGGLRARQHHHHHHQQQVAMRHWSPGSASDHSDHGGHHRSRGHQSYHQGHRSSSPTHQVVEVPEVYRRNKEQMLNRKGLAASPSRSSSHLSMGHRSPTRSRQNQQHQKHPYHHHQHHHQREDASVQARLTDEEIERRSMSSDNSHRNKIKSGGGHRHSTRDHHFGQTTHQPTTTTTKILAKDHNSKTLPSNDRKRPKSPASISSASSSDLDPKLRRDGVRSRDSGFRSPNQGTRTKDIYSVSSKKHPSRDGAISPGSMRSVKTTTTTLVGGLDDDRKKRSNSVREYSRSAGGGSHRKSTDNRDKVSRRQKHSHGPKDELSATRMTTHNESLDDSLSLSSFGPHSTTIRVPYKPKARRSYVQQPDVSDCESITTIMHDNYRDTNNSNQQHSSPQARYEYRTIVANVMPANNRKQSQSSPNGNQEFATGQKQIAEMYHVRVVDHNSPFKTDQLKPAKTVSELSESIARLLSEVESHNLSNQPKKKEAGPTGSDLDNNNQEANLNFNEGNHVQYKAMPARTRDSIDDEDDVLSVISIGSSLRSHKTYHVGPAIAKSEQLLDDLDLNHVNDFPVETISQMNLDNGLGNDNKRGGAAWYFDPTNNSTKAIVPPPRPRDTVPQVDQVTETLGETNGGRSYYLELIEKPKVEPKKLANVAKVIPNQHKTPQSKSTTPMLLRSKCASQAALGNRPQTPVVKAKHTKSTNLLGVNNSSKLDATKKDRQIKPASLLDHRSRPLAGSSLEVSSGSTTSIAQPGRVGPPSLGDRSKSSSCLAVNSTRSKYSIYGGLKDADRANKPVPRLSYSRAIGPKSHVQTKTAQIKTAPSRYLKIK